MSTPIDYDVFALNLWAKLDIQVNLPGLLDRQQSIVIIARWLEENFAQVSPALHDYHQKLTAAAEGKIKMQVALLTIRDLPFPEQDNMISANMRRIATDTLHDAG